MVKEVLKIEDPWVKGYDLLVKKLKEIGMPDTMFEQPDWRGIRNLIKHYCILSASHKSIVKLLKLFDHVHKEGI